MNAVIGRLRITTVAMVAEAFSRKLELEDQDSKGKPLEAS